MIWPHWESLKVELCSAAFWLLVTFHLEKVAATMLERENDTNISHNQGSPSILKWITFNYRCFGTCMVHLCTYIYHKPCYTMLMIKL